ncbi:polyphenol oxidase family protein [Candidatus Saccharibacteria bacterium]|nr:polyphenol oxidase family protein [Candidatus Saccharibacteria bacterium]
MPDVIIKTIDDAITVGYAGKKLGNTNIKFGLTDEAEANFEKFIAKFPGKTVYDMPAVGKDTIIDVDSLTPGELWELEADALITERPPALLVLKAADCMPLVFYVPGKNILCLAHVGTSGAALHLPTKVIKALGSPAKQIHCYIGPSIRKESYRMSKDHFEEKKQEINIDESWNKYITEADDYIHINLFGYVMDELIDNGILKENIHVEDIDTGSDKNYFSHRRHRSTGEEPGRNTLGVHLI